MAANLGEVALEPVTKFGGRFVARRKLLRTTPPRSQQTEEAEAEQCQRCGFGDGGSSNNMEIF